MKRCALILFAALIALPVCADEPAPVQDSPLVAAAKRAKMTKKTATVITNETLKQSGAGAHVTTTKKQAALPKAQAAAPAATSKKPVADKPKKKSQRQARQHDDAERLEDDPGRGDLVDCPACLPVLEPVSETLPLRTADTSANPPRVAAPEMPPVVTPRVPEAPPLF